MKRLLKKVADFVGGVILASVSAGIKSGRHTRASEYNGGSLLCWSSNGGRRLGQLALSPLPRELKGTRRLPLPRELKGTPRLPLECEHG